MANVSDEERWICGEVGAQPCRIGTRRWKRPMGGVPIQSAKGIEHSGGPRLGVESLYAVLKR